MKVLVTGCNGQLGHELHDALDRRPQTDVTYIDREDLDLTDADAVREFLTRGEFTHVVNCAAYTAVDLAEEEKSLCTAVNVQAVRNIAINAESLGLKIIHISTDYVFDGTANMPYRESAKTSPLSHYGNTKRKSETDLLGLAPDSIIIRTQWLYSPCTDRNFIGAIIRRADKTGKLRVVADQIGTPTYAADLAEAIATMLHSQQWTAGIYHYSDEGVASWYDFAKAVMKLTGRNNVDVQPIATADYPTAAARPIYAVLDKSLIKATYGLSIPHWQDSLEVALARLQPSTNDK